MGRIKTKPIKRACHELMKKHSTEFKEVYTENKEVVSRFATIRSKKLRNIVTGYITRLAKNKDMY